MSTISRNVKIELSGQNLQNVVDVLNRDLDEEDGDVLLTVEEVCDTSSLSDYLLDCYASDSDVLHDPAEVWNMDGFCEWQDYRS